MFQMGTGFVASFGEARYDLCYRYRFLARFENAKDRVGG